MVKHFSSHGLILAVLFCYKTSISFGIEREFSGLIHTSTFLLLHIFPICFLTLRTTFVLQNVSVHNKRQKLFNEIEIKGGTGMPDLLFITQINNGHVENEL